MASNLGLLRLPKVVAKIHGRLFLGQVFKCLLFWGGGFFQGLLGISGIHLSNELFLEGEFTVERRFKSLDW